MCQLGLDHIGGYAVDALNHQRARHCSEPVGAHFVGRKAHAPKGCIDGVVAHGPFARAQAGEHIAAMSREGLQVFQNGNGLRGQAINYTEGTMPGTENARIQVVCWAATRAAAIALMKQAEAAIRAAPVIQVEPLGARVSGYEQDTNLYSSQQDFSIWTAR